MPEAGPVPGRGKNPRETKPRATPRRPERTGLFLGQCGTYCGTQHAWMLLRVYVHTREDFDQWVAQQKKLPENDPAVAAGRLVFERTACINCHAVGGTGGNGRFGPDLTHVMSRDTLGSGALSWTLRPQLTSERLQAKLRFGPWSTNKGCMANSERKKA